MRVIRGERDRLVVLNEPLTWTDPDGTVITIPAGFTSDGASLPSSVWWLLGGKLSLEWISAAIVHDFSVVFYATTAPFAPSHRVAAERFYRGIRADGMGFNRAKLAQHAVTMFGPQWASPHAAESAS